MVDFQDRDGDHEFVTSKFSWWQLTLRLSLILGFVAGIVLYLFGSQIFAASKVVGAFAICATFILLFAGMFSDFVSPILWVKRRQISTPKNHMD